MFKDNRAPEKGLQLPEIPSGGDDNECVFDATDELEVDEVFGFCLLGFFAGRNPGREAMKLLCAKWGVEYMFLYHDSGWIIFSRELENDRLKVLRGGPYRDGSIQLHIRTMPKYFNFDTKEMCMVPVWAKLHNWPLGYWNEKALGKFSSLLGDPVCSDSSTGEKAKTLLC